MTLTEEPSGLWRLDTGGTLIGYDGEHNVCSIQIKLANVIGTWTWYLDIAYLDGTVATVPLEQVKDTISVLLSRSYMREGLTVVQVRGVSAGSAVKKSSVARVRFGSSVNASEQLAPPTPSQWDIYAAQIAGYRDEAAASAAAAALAATQMPYINSGGTWSVWSTSAGGFVDSGVSAAGITPDIQIGSVTTLPAGSAATASMSGTAAEPLLNLGIPKGDPGSGGGTGALYMRVDNGVIQYSADGVSWSDLITTAELTGPAGSQGEQGPPGSDGVSPTVIVTQTATGAVITATDAGGTTSATVFNGQDGSPGAAGSPGADGHTPEITASKSGKVTTIMVDGAAIAEIDDGADGAPGSAGDDGITPDIQIGTVTTLPAGSEATASMSGTTAAPLLNLGIPKGDKGDAGGASAADLSLGLTSATVGQTIKVKAVDADGKPTAWEAVDMGGVETWEKLIFSIPESDPVSAATINLPSTNIIKACITISLFGTLENTKFAVKVFTGAKIGSTFLSADITNFYTSAQEIRTGNIMLEKKAGSWQSIYNTEALFGNRNTTGALRFISYNSDYLYISTSTANETFYGTIEVNYVIGGSI